MKIQYKIIAFEGAAPIITTKEPPKFVRENVISVEKRVVGDWEPYEPDESDL